MDTNVVISGLFFGGNPGMVLRHIVSGGTECFASPKILKEYQEVFGRMISKGKGRDPGTEGLSMFVSSLSFVEDSGKAKVSRDPDDNKFIDCAVSSKSLYIVSGDDDLLSLRSYGDVKIITAKEFVDSFIRQK